MSTKVRGIRGATTADANTPEAIYAATAELLAEMTRANGVETDDIAYANFSVTADLDAAFPPTAARERLGWTRVAMMCANEMASPGGQPRCIRVALLINTDKTADEIEYVYLRGAAGLRARGGRGG